VFAVEPRRLRCAQEELTAVGIGTGVGHTENARTGVCQFEVLVWELIAVYGLTAGAVVTGEVAALTHELGDDAVERTSLESQLSSFLAGAEGAEVLRGLWNDIGAEFHDDSTSVRAADSDVEEDLRV